MGKYSNITWCDHTFNPFIGCTKVSPGCKNCYAEREMDHHYHKVRWGPEGTRLHTSPNYWRQPQKWDEDPWVECMVCGWRGSLDDTEVNPAGLSLYCCPKCNGIVSLTRQRVFCASLADVFEIHPDVNTWRDGLWKLMMATPSLDWLVLTKRPQNVEGMVPESWKTGSWPRNVWLGVSAEDQQRLDARMPVLEKLGRTLNIPVIFVSAEPLLGPLDLDGWVEKCTIFEEGGEYIQHPIDWVIVGGESGPAARPMNPRWVTSLQDQCLVAGRPFFFKQWGEWCAPGCRLKRDADPITLAKELKQFMDASHKNIYQVENEDDLVLFRVGKVMAGDHLDGQTWHDWPRKERA